MSTRLVDFSRKWIPRRVRYLLQRFVSLSDVKLRYRQQTTTNADVLEGNLNETAGSPPIGIIKNNSQYHCHYVTACLEMGVPFKVLDIFRDDWLHVVRASGCDVLLVWPDATMSIWNDMVKDRIDVLRRDLNMPVFPMPHELWMYEDKRRMLYWLEAHDVPHPDTWVFYDLARCVDFVRSCRLPIVFKANFGASASGVRILHNRSSAVRFVKRVFRKGFVPDGFHRQDRQWGNVVLQQFEPDIKEWRLVRIGDSFFGHVKGQSGEFHSGSGLVSWEVPEGRHLDFLEDVTDKGGFRSMNVDVFETTDGRLLVNELQAVFGASHSVHQLKVDGVPGRFVRNEFGAWQFEAGDFARNACANERVRFVIEHGRRLPESAEL